MGTMFRKLIEEQEELRGVRCTGGSELISQVPVGMGGAGEEVGHAV